MLLRSTGLFLLAYLAFSSGASGVGMSGGGTFDSFLLSLQPEITRSVSPAWMVGEAVVDAVKPKMICSGATAYPSLIDFKTIRDICDEVGAIMWVDAAHFIGLVAGKAIPSPVPYADVVSFTTHKVLRGPRGGMILAKGEHGAAIDKAVFPGMQGGPIMSAVAAKAVALKECLQPSYQKYAKDVVHNAQALAAGLVEEGMRAVSGGTQTHLALILI